MKEEKRLVLVAEGWDGSTGGVQRYLLGLMNSLATWNATVVGSKEGQLINGVEVIERRFLWPFFRPRWLPLWLFVKKLTRERDPQVLLGGKALFEGLLLLKLGLPYGIFTYAMEIETWLKDGREKKLRQVFGGAAVVFYMNQRTKRRLEDLGVAEDKLVFLPPAVDDYFLEEALEVDEQLQALELHSPYMLTAGRLVERKGFDTVLEAFAKLDQTSWNNLSLVVAGDGPEREHLEQLSQQLYLNNRDGAGAVHFLGAVTDEELRALYAGCEFFVSAPRDLPGDMEGFGIVFLEAAAQAKAVLATRSGGVSGAVEDKKTGMLVDADNSTALAKAMEQLLLDKQLAREMGLRGRQRVATEFTWQKAVRVLESALDKIV